MPRALISVSNKTGIVDFAKFLADQGIEIMSTGGTLQVLAEAGVPAIAVEEVTGFPEILDGRVKTLHPKIHGGLLARRDQASHRQALADYGIEAIDYVVVNLYPFKETLVQAHPSHADLIENIDIGGPSMLRSAAKNYQSVTVLTDPADYGRVRAELETNGQTSLDLRAQLAAKVFRQTAQYDALIAQYLTAYVGEEEVEKLTLTYDLKQELRYGENSHQAAAFYQDPLAPAYSLVQAQQLQGKELSYNNIKDADAALRILAEFQEPTALAVKHMNPCGLGQAETIELAFQRCYEADSQSIYGGIVAVNRPVTQELAEALRPIFLEIVIAPSFDAEALEILSAKKKLRLLALDHFDQAPAPAKEYVSVMGGLLVQDQDIPQAVRASDWPAMGQVPADNRQDPALELAWKLVKHVKSNAIVVANAVQSLGIGAGQMNRVGACELAIQQALANSHDVDQSHMVLASDAYLPMADTAEYAVAHGIQAIVQPSGSIHDDDSIAVTDAAGIPMLKTGRRHFRH
ncbi:MULTISPECIES: bifunctional phosphoribosylaminoimidazolecarboxamide formyltransferase/IMP cyclohydrolase [Aerococcus]|uniref:Bifunctional purine biosynthesis protein PurH n=1 Tax=Aerococcus sanguinicola TaxID=119206 RepID=A0A5N1GLI6_9LACT|nr:MULTISPECIES: bifunctional phosphoribosylaminoimidazolecarboxamide formyltransferase/IMP cyclohydrolase [Aerococcus]KAA9301186.1 bifunctional phosphoribosylaminoimidazolecarboxamide formyltransferase/IMP cyclohydrolase [Aerococcus sanguinicola]MDK6369284.1 bifunctional phosphoribosylaminoimidazolecarboxamide formyltransferase/IMP cyclohydrolase [Aerococcus sp. UMB9870]MDK6679108.1 bifunctional phosphoribosylaminoimidazolecarboxamide formyltransferase/IMP cyclohydrolase [Aerococcus sp. UMB8608